jgi:hypothetical protein
MAAKQLLFSITKKDLKIEWFSGTSAGGQYRNKHQNCIRIHHPESGALVTGQSNRERKSNQREAMRNLVNDPKFKLWHTKKCYEVMSGQTIDDRVDKMMADSNIKVECKDELGRWVDGSTKQR